MSSDSPDTRTRILKATIDLLEAGSGGDVRMSDIARKASISRQALYLHFRTRAELLIATTRYLDEIKDIDARLAASRTARTGTDRLNAFVAAWGSYIPEIYGIARALIAMCETDAEAAAAWALRMQDMREGCEAAINALHSDGKLSPDFRPQDATDILWTMLSVRNWEQLTIECGWPQEKYIETLRSMTQRLFVKPE